MSKDDAGSGDLGIERQRTAAEHLAKAKGLEIVPEWVIEETASASDRRKTRPGFERLLLGMAAGEFEAVLAYAVDRLVRGLDDLTRLIDTAEEFGIAVSTVSGDIDMSNAHGRGLAKLLGVVASIETDNMGERMRRRKQQNARNGVVRAGGRRPYGFTANRAATVPEEAEVIKKAAARIIAGDSLTGVVWDMNRRSVPTSYGGAWTLARLQATLSRPSLCGRVSYKGEVLRDDDGHLVRGEWDPILTDDEFDQLQIAIKARRHDPAPVNNRRRHLLSGLMRCGLCGEGMLGFKQRSKTMTYTCGPRRHLSRLMAPVDAHVIAMVKARAEEAFFPVESWSDGERQAVQRQVAMLEERKRAAALEFADGSLPADMLRTIADDLQSKIDTLRETQVDHHIDMQTVKWVNFPFENFEALDVHSQHAAIRMFVSKIVLLPAGRGSRKFNPDLVQIEWRDLSNFRFSAVVESS
ncbi:recombinase family protein [Aeromicrobium fastidiosum]|nr:recombinase family protein [Aeromicrobium fastidiosum]